MGFTNKVMLFSVAVVVLLVVVFFIRSMSGDGKWMLLIFVAGCAGLYFMLKSLYKEYGDGLNE